MMIKRIIFSALLGVTPTIAAEIKRESQLGEITEYSLRNGMRVILAPNLKSPMTYFSLVYLSGTANDPIGKVGTAHLVEHLMFAKDGSPTGIGSSFEERGISFNASTAYDRTRYLAVFKNSEENLNFLLELERTRMERLHFGNIDLEREKRMVNQEISWVESDATGQLIQAMAAEAWGTHGYSYPVLGKKSDIDNISADDIQKFHGIHYRPNNAVLVLTGSFDPKKALDKINSLYSELESKKTAINNEQNNYKQRSSSKKIEITLGSSNVSILSFPIPPAVNRSNLLLSMSSVVMASEPSGRLYQALVKPGFAQNVFAFYNSRKDGGEFLLGALVADGYSHEFVENIILYQLSQLSEKPISKDELHSAKQSSRVEQNQLLKNSASLADAISEFAAVGDWHVPVKQAKHTESIDTKLAQKYITTLLSANKVSFGRLYAAVVQDTESAPPPRSAMHSLGYESSPDGQGMHIKEADFSVFNKRLQALESIVQRTELQNGMKLSLHPESNQSGYISGQVNLRFGNGDQLDIDRSISDLLGTLLLRGTKYNTYEEIISKVSSMGATISIVPSGSVLTATFSAPKQHLNSVACLLSDILRRPLLSEEEFLIVKNMRSNEIQSRIPAAVQLARHEQGKYIKKETNQELTLESAWEAESRAIINIQVGDVRAFHHKYYGAQYGEISFSGEFDPTEVKHIAEENFGDWKSRAEYVPRSFAHEVPPASRIDLSSKNKDRHYYGRLYLKLERAGDLPEIALVQEILAAHPVTSRLGRRLRQKEGISYSIESNYYLSDNSQFAWIDLEADFPAGAGEKIFSAIADEIKVLKYHGTTNSEFVLAKNNFLSKRQLSLESPGRLLGLLNYQARTGRNFNEWIRQNDYVNNLSLDSFNIHTSAALKESSFLEILVDDKEKYLPPKSNVPGEL